MELGGVDVRLLAIFDDPVAVGVVSDEADGFEREVGVELAKVFEDVIRTSAVAHGFGLDGGEGVLLGPGVDDFDVVRDEVSSGDDSFSVRRHFRRRSCFGWRGRRRRFPEKRRLPPGVTQPNRPSNKPSRSRR